LGLLLASGFAAASAAEIRGPRAGSILRRRAWLSGGLAVLLIGWAIASLAGLPPLDRPPEEEAPLAFRLLTPVGIGLYVFAAWRYWRLYRLRRRTLPLSVAVSFALLAEALIAVAFSRSWHASWWEWHVLMAIAFATVLVAIRNEYRHVGTVAGAFGGLYLEQTLERLDRRSSEALSQLVRTIQTGDPLAPVLERLRRDGFASDELVLLERAARELARVDQLFRPYVGPQLAARLEREPQLAALGGREADVTVLFADLAGFTDFSDDRSPTDVVEMLNAYWAGTVPILAEREEGLIERFAGDAILVVFNALDDQPDHPVRAVRAAVEMQRAAERIAQEHTGWPRFRIGVNTGPAALGNVGAGPQRSFTAIGDTTNVAARLQTAARPGRILIGPATYESVRDVIPAQPLGELELKGKPAPVPAFDVPIDGADSA
jgi:class 3 adenylate cyclase